MQTGFWERSWLWLGLALLSLIPFGLVDVPPLVDLPGHIGRYHIALDLDRSLYLARYYDFHWAVIGNLGADLLVVPLSRIMTVERAAWTIAAAVPPLTILGIWATARAVHGRVPPTALLALSFVFSLPFFFGFLNYVLAAALALLAFALWVTLGNRPTLRAALFVPIAGLIWLCHASGWGLLGLLIAGYEAAQAGRLRDLARHWLKRLWPLLTPVPAMLIWQGEGDGGIAFTPYWLSNRLVWLISAIRHGDMALDIGLALIVYAVLLGLLVTKRVRILPAMAVSAAFVAVAWALMPSAMFRSFYADMRLTPMMLIAGILALTWSGSAAAAARVAWVGVALFVAQLALVSIGWAKQDQAYERHLQALDHVPAGSRLLALMPQWSFRAPPWLCGADSWRLDALSHLPDLAIVRRDAFVNTQWARAGSQLLVVRYNRDTRYHADPSQFVIVGAGCRGSHKPAMRKILDEFPRERFDFVWLLRTSQGLPSLPGWLERVYADEDSALYRISVKQLGQMPAVPSHREPHSATLR